MELYLVLHTPTISDMCRFYKVAPLYDHINVNLTL